MEKKLTYKVQSKGRKTVYQGVSNTALIGVLKTIRFNNRVLNNPEGVVQATKMIKSLERLKKLPDKQSKYARSKRTAILSKIPTVFDVDPIRFNKNKTFSLIVPKLKVTDTFKAIYRNRIKIDNRDIYIKVKSGGYIDDELDQTWADALEFWEIVDNMGGLSYAYKRYQEDVERIADRFNIDLRATRLAN